MPARALRGPMLRIRALVQHGVTRRFERAVGGPARLRVIVLLASVLGLSSADTATVGAVAAPLEAGLHIGNTQLGLLVTVSTAIGAIATLPVGVAVDRVRRVRLLTLAIVIWCAAMLVSALAVSYLMLLLTRIALGAVIAAAGPAVASLTGDFFAASERGRIYGYILTGELAGAGIGLLISGDIAGVLSWRASFAWLALPGLALAWAIQRGLPEPDRGGQSRLHTGDTDIRSAEDAANTATRPEPGSPGCSDPDENQDDAAEPVVEEVERAGVRPHAELVLHTDSDRMPLTRAVRYILSIRTNVVLIISSALGYFFFSGLRTFAVAFARSHFGLGQSAASTLLVLIGAGAIIGVLTGGRIADREIRTGRLAARPLVAGVAFLLAATLFLPGLLITSLLLAVPLLFLAAGVYSATNPPLDAARLDVMQHHLWGRAEAVRTVLRSLLEAAAPLIFGYVSSRFGGGAAGLSGVTGHGNAAGGAGLDTTFLIMLIPLALSGVLLLTAARARYPRDVATAIASEQNTRHARAGGKP